LQEGRGFAPAFLVFRRREKWHRVNDLLTIFRHPASAKNFHAGADSLNDLSGRIIGCAFTELNALGAGFAETIYRMPWPMKITDKINAAG
jgi:hypothetical protein